MYLSDDLRAYALSILTNPLFQQLLPFCILFFIPFLILFTAHTVNHHRSYILWSAAMVLESIGLGLPWNWTNGAHASGSSGHERKKSKKKHVRTKSEQQIVSNGHAKHGR